jgi:hypothetical protein
MKELDGSLFKSFIDLEDNHRIIFSAKFGAGKTYFLKSFFKDHSASYEAVFLYPVNYQVSANEDIFELVKFDLLRSLLKILPKRKVIPADYKHIVDKFKALRNNEQGVLKKLLKLTSKLTRGVTVNIGLNLGLEASLDLEISQIINNFIELSEKDPKEQNTEPTPEEHVRSFLKEIKATQKLYEDTAITHFIKNATKRIKKDGNKKLVLVIDDFDRIDPEHIFRLLNIFSAHLQDSEDDENTEIGVSAHDNDLVSERDIDNPKEEEKLADRYGFDRVIFVCDINNIQSIFHHKYGLETDFNGYIDKFYSKAIFEFSNQDTIKNKLNSVLERFYEVNKFLEMSVSYSIGQATVLTKSTKDLFENFLYHFLLRAITDKVINFRDIERLYGSKLLQKGGKSIEDYIYVINITEQEEAICFLPEIILFEILTIIFGDISAILKCIQTAHYGSSSYRLDFNGAHGWIYEDNPGSRDPVGQIFIDNLDLMHTISFLACMQGKIKKIPNPPLRGESPAIQTRELSFNYKNSTNKRRSSQSLSIKFSEFPVDESREYLRIIVQTSLTGGNDAGLELIIGSFSESLRVLSEANLLN